MKTVSQPVKRFVCPALFAVASILSIRLMYATDTMFSGAIKENFHILLFTELSFLLIIALRNEFVAAGIITAAAIALSFFCTDCFFVFFPCLLFSCAVKYAVTDGEERGIRVFNVLCAAILPVQLARLIFVKKRSGIIAFSGREYTFVLFLSALCIMAVILAVHDCRLLMKPVGTKHGKTKKKKSSDAFIPVLLSMASLIITVVYSSFFLGTDFIKNLFFQWLVFVAAFALFGKKLFGYIKQ